MRIHDENMASRTLLIKENIAGHAIDWRMLIWQNNPSNWSFTEFLIRCYQYTQNSPSSKTRMLEKHASGDICGQYISKYCSNSSQKSYDLLQQPHAFYTAAATCTTFENNLFYFHLFNPLRNIHATSYSILHVGKPRAGQTNWGLKVKYHNQFDNYR